MGSGAGLEVEGLHFGVFVLTGLLRLPESTSLYPNSDIIQFGGSGFREGGFGAQGFGLEVLGLVWEFVVEGLRVYSRREM